MKALTVRDTSKHTVQFAINVIHFYHPLKFCIWFISVLMYLFLFVTFLCCVFLCPICLTFPQQNVLCFPFAVKFFPEPQKLKT